MIICVCVTRSLAYVCTHTLCLNANITSGVTVESFPLSSEQCYLLKLVLFQLAFIICIPCKCNRVPQDGTNKIKY